MNNIDRNRGWNRPDVGVTFARAEVNTFQYRAEDHDMPIAGYHAVGVEGPNARANCRASLRNGFEARAQLSAGKIKGDVGYVTAELNPNLTTAVSYGRNGVETRIGGVGGSISRKGVGLHTPIGSFGVRF